MSLKKSLRLLAMAVVVAGCVLVIPASFGTIDDACADGQCLPGCPHTRCVTNGCGADGLVSTPDCTYGVIRGPAIDECVYGCKTLKCGTN